MTGGDYRRLPDPVRPEDLVAEVDTRPVPDPDGGVDSPTLSLLRDSAG